VIVGVGGLVVVVAFVVLATLSVGVDERRVVVLMLVVMGPVLEFAERAAGMVVRDVIVVVGMDRRGVGVLVLHVADDALGGACLQDAPPRRREPLSSAVGTKAATRWSSSSGPGTACAPETRDRVSSPYRLLFAALGS
jgi:hypothetical protein